ncbi:Methenyltetrahydromethanopterin cyclohydrolase [Caulifigura coniformis]|uniref:Methenyltetrahydromethanopterin cyclohydrolase n=1 Tax=Caulifigura coniformis TaxID=2527983 RepID=A0A517SBQ6_9PLAN|nr:methenyltetrahydromethanopterin cyclohydrolase [Caulifigura coniformis]QDT53553.1 Methenyltetrahydromethanopterin cyclohydrolase [Caulifigura coniformis]
MSEDFELPEDDFEEGAEENPSLLNDAAFSLVNQALAAVDELRVEAVDVQGAGCILDFGVETTGSLAAGLALAEICMAGLGEIQISNGEVAGCTWPHLNVSTDNPTEACLLSQYAGWKVNVGKFFGMGSGPMRAAYADEAIFSQLDYREDATAVIGVLETGRLPDLKVVKLIAEKCKVEPERVALLAAPTSSIAGNMQVVARSVETALHKLHELGFDTTQVVSAFGTAPISPVAADDLAAIGRTNDAILYGGRVTLWVEAEDEELRMIGPNVPSSSSSAYGKPFVDIFKESGHDFYKIDPLLFSPAEIVFHNLETGSVFRFGEVNSEVLKRSFGL